MSVPKLTATQLQARIYELGANLVVSDVSLASGLWFATAFMPTRTVALGARFASCELALEALVKKLEKKS